MILFFIFFTLYFLTGIIKNSIEIAYDFNDLRLLRKEKIVNESKEK